LQLQKTVTKISQVDMDKPTIAIVGASSDRCKYGNRAVRAYVRQGYDVYPIHPREPMIEGQRAYRSLLDVPVAQLDRVSMYVPSSVGIQLLDDIARRPPRELWLNPGSESDALIARAAELGLNVVIGCSIVAIGETP
jgi:predicted CoA-binding protein